MAKLLATPETRADIDTAEIMSYAVDPAKKSIDVKIAKRAAGETAPNAVLRHVISGADYDTLMDAMGDNLKDLKTQLEDALWAELEAKGVVDVA